MSAPKIQADYDSLSEIAKHFAAKAQDTNSLIQTVDRCVDELRHGAWIGKGADQFYAEMEQLVSPAMLRLRNALEDASSATTRIAQALERHEREAAALFYGGDGAGGAVSAAGAAAVAAGGVLNFLREIIQGGRDPRNGFIKARDKLISKVTDFAFDRVMPYLAEHGSRALQKSMKSIGGKLLDIIAERSGGTIKEFLQGTGRNLVDSAAERSSEALKFLKGTGGKVVSGVLGGVVDIALAGGAPDGNAVFDQLVSGGIQGAIAATKVGAVVLLADAGIQIFGNVATQLVSDHAEWLAHDNKALAAEMIKTSNALSLALDNLSLDNRMDGIVGAIRNGVQTGDVLGAVGGVATELGRFVIGGVGGTIVEGAQLAWQVSTGLASRVSEAVGNMANNVSTAVGNFFSFLW